jgi:trans-2,3-dihydro-3-hydroxyanthranilate isomerase
MMHLVMYLESEVELIMEQGQEINKDGEVSVYVNKQEDRIEVKISGTAVYVDEIIVYFNT